MSLSILYTHTHSLGRMNERGEVLSSERERQKMWISSLCFWVLLLPLVLVLSLRKLGGFLLYVFLEENYKCLLSLVIISMQEWKKCKVLNLKLKSSMGEIFELWKVKMLDMLVQRRRHGIRANLRRRHCAAAESRAY